ncbi:hypothetical protein D0T51_02610 [Parabacteroides sp. 52]|uniref:hypothetical protein n=1 Tax=unclassified Parabacteroides TaxID=2649774 RepID=UPI0013D5B157|nr:MULTISPECIES: hypothetical protein [unclassified Parabacteroides]MDH6533881.1 membrane-bound ClpP family serine protease [Parabacteroides sp. PM5-20]NDV54626.1 hypothetical protein [Parabacteroides sp. 52]
MKKINNRVFLYSGLFLLFIAFLVRWLECPGWLFISLFVAAILLKAVFLFHTFRTKGCKLSLWLGLILAGVILIFISILFKTLFPVPFLRNLLFYTAILLKVTGLILMLVSKKAD